MISGKATADLRLLPALLVLLFSPSAMAELSLDMLMEQFTRISSAEVRFREEKQLALLQAPLVVEGTLSYQAPDYLRKEVTLPEHSLFEIRGDTLYIETGNEQRTLSLDSHPLIRAFAESWRALLSGNGKTLKRHFETELSGNIEHWTLRLQPRDAQARTYIEAIIIIGSGVHIHSAETLEASGDTTLMTIMADDD
jgi:outer membrane lipoprotein-sorting protein